MSEKYNGWSNYPTWCVKMWLDNDETLYDRVEEMVTDYHDISTWKIADMIKDMVQEDNPLTTESSLYSDLLQSAIDDVNFHEIAESYQEEFLDENEEDEDEDDED